MTERSKWSLTEILASDARQIFSLHLHVVKRQKINEKEGGYGSFEPLEKSVNIVLIDIYDYYA